MVDGIGRIKSQIRIEAIVYPERSSQRRRHSELIGASDDVSTRVAEVAGWLNEGGRVEKQALRVAI